MTTKHEPVIFENSLGETISNDPIWHAQKTLEAAGIAVGQVEQNTPADPDDSDQEIDKAEDYKSLDGKALKALAGEREVDITGLKTVGEVRAALVADDVAKAAKAEVDAANASE